MFRAGGPTPDRQVLELARRLRAPDSEVTVAKPEHGSSAETKVLALDIDDEETLLRAMEDWCPPELRKLRAVSDRADRGLPSPVWGRARPRPTARVERAALAGYLVRAPIGGAIRGRRARQTAGGWMASGGPVRRRFAVFRSGGGTRVDDAASGSLARRACERLPQKW